MSKKSLKEKRLLLLADALKNNLYRRKKTQKEKI